MYTIFAFGNDFHDLVKSILSCVTDFKSTSCYKTSIVDREDHRVKYGFVFIVKGTVYENIIFIMCRYNVAYVLCCFF